MPVRYPKIVNKSNSIESLISPSAFEHKSHLTNSEMNSVVKRHSVSFKNAFNGIVIAFRTQPNFRFHITFLILINILAIVLQISIGEYVVLLMLCTIVLFAEMANTAFEALGDEIAKGEYRKLIGVAKDVAAGAVLIVAIGAVLIGIIIFVPKLIMLVV